MQFRTLVLSDSEILRAFYIEVWKAYNADSFTGNTFCRRDHHVLVPIYYLDSSTGGDDTPVKQ